MNPRSPTDPFLQLFLPDLLHTIPQYWLRISPPRNGTKSTVHHAHTIPVAHADDLRDQGPQVRYACDGESGRYLVHLHRRRHSVDQPHTVLAEKQRGAARDHGCVPGDLITATLLIVAARLLVFDCVGKLSAFTALAVTTDMVRFHQAYRRFQQMTQPWCESSYSHSHDALRRAPPLPPPCPGFLRRICRGLPVVDEDQRDANCSGGRHGSRSGKLCGSSDTYNKSRGVHDTTIMVQDSWCGVVSTMRGKPCCFLFDGCGGRCIQAALFLNYPPPPIYIYRLCWRPLANTL